MKTTKFLNLLAILPAFAALAACDPGFFIDECYDPYFGYYQCDNSNDVFTIQAAIDLAQPGDTVFIKRGTYSPSTNGESFPIFMKSGVNLQGEDPSNTIIDAQGTDHVLDLFNYNGGVISNFTVTNGNDDTGAGIRAENSSGTLQNLIVNGNRASDEGSGIYIKNSSGLVITNTVVYGNAESTSGGSDPAQVEIDDSNVTFNNNVVALGDSDGLRLNFGSAGTFENNIFYQNGFAGQGSGFADTDAATSATILYNICFANSESDFFLNGMALTALQANNLSGTDSIANNFSANPLFNNPNGGDFTLQVGSPAIQAGDPNPAFNNPDGTRNDIGAYGGPFADD
ncbi:MAG: right-handed parallel beta-helix repeat-containing protein [bacterium]